jgi:galactokinase/mevalonate kinase-like predicted kinase
LAKSILQDVTSKVNANIPSYLFIHHRLKELADASRDAISLRNYESLASTIAESWKTNKLIHPSTTNEEIEELLRRTAPYYSGMKLLGAGGGGYALFASKTECHAEKLRDTLDSASPNSNARIVDFSMNPYGLKVTVS